jgi:large subunit ribosomal protein L10
MTRNHAVNELTKLFKESDSAIVANFQRVGVNKVQNLKKPLKLSGAKFKVVKNSMARIAAKNANFEPLVPLFEGTCAVTFCNQDTFLSASKVFVNFAKENEGFKICGGSLIGKFVSTEEIKELALLPSKEVLIAKAIGTMKSPISGFVGVLSNVVNGFVRVVDQINKKKNEVAK